MNLMIIHFFEKGENLLTVFDDSDPESILKS